MVTIDEAACGIHSCVHRPLGPHVSSANLATTIARHWDDDIVAQLTDYVRIPAKSPHFDPDWKKNGHIDRVVALAEAWVRRQKVRGLELETVRLKGRTPLLYFT